VQFSTSHAAAVWAEAREHRRLTKHQYDDVINPARIERDTAIDLAMASRDTVIARADRMYSRQRQTLVASLRKELARTKRTYAEQIKSLGETTWDRLVQRAPSVVGSACELKPWQNIELTVEVCQMVLWLEPTRAPAATRASEHRRAHTALVEGSRRQCQEQERWHKERGKARAILKWGRDRRQRICKTFVQTGGLDLAIASLSNLIREDESATMPYVRAQEYLRRQKGIHPGPTLAEIMRRRSA
jgi:hypothetical protein